MLINQRIENLYKMVKHTKKDKKTHPVPLSELNFDDVEPTYIREKSLCEKKVSKVSEREHKNKSKKPLINE